MGRAFYKQATPCGVTAPNANWRNDELCNACSKSRREVKAHHHLTSSLLAQNVEYEDVLGGFAGDRGWVIAARKLARASSPVQAQGAPNLVWEALTPSSLANSIQGVDWSPVPSGDIVFGSTDRWLRTRQADNGALSYSVLQPHRSGGVNQAIYSSDGTFIAVHNSSGGLDYRVHRAVDGVFLGLLSVTIDTQGLVHFAPDLQLIQLRSRPTAVVSPFGVRTPAA